MRVSIIGSNGFLSTAIAKFCNDKGWNLNVFGLSEPDQHQYDHFYRINLMQEELDVNTLLDSSIIIYAAGAGIQSNLRDDSSLIFRLNVIAPVAVCNNLKNRGYKGILVTFGSYFEIGEVDTEKAFSEEDILSAISPAPNDYIISKRMLSCFVASYKHDFTHWHFYLPTIYGERENPVRLIPYTINSIKANIPFHFTSGTQTRQYIYVEDIPKMLELSFEKGLPSGIYNVAGRDIMTVREIVERIHCVLGKDVPDNCFGSAQRDDVGMRYLVLNGEKLERNTGFVAKTRLDDVIDRY